MSVITSASDIINALSGGKIPSLDMLISKRTGGNNGAPETFHYNKPAPVLATAGLVTSFWNVDGVPCAGGIPGAWANPTNATPGAIPFTSPGGGRTKFLVSELGYVSISGMLCIYDRLGHCGGLSGTTTGAQNVNSGSPGTITRNTGGVGNEIWAEIYTAVGTTATTITASYTNQAGTAGQTSMSTTFGGATFGIPQIVPIAIAANDYGVQAVTSVTLAASTVSAAGNFGVTIARPLVYIPMGGLPYPQLAQFVNGGLSAVDSTSSLAMAWFATTTNSAQFGMHAFIEMVEG